MLNALVIIAAVIGGLLLLTWYANRPIMGSCQCRHAESFHGENRGKCHHPVAKGKPGYSDQCSCQRFMPIR